MSDLYLSLDIGTSSVRAIIFDENGYQKCMKSIECSFINTSEGKAELDPVFIFESGLEVIRDCVSSVGLGKSKLAGIGMSCHMHSLMLVDREGKPLTNLLTWADNRGAAEAGLLADKYDAAELYIKTGCRVQHPLYPLSKLMWFKNREPELFSSAYKFITIKEYIIFKLYGQFLVDYTLASCQGYYNIHTQNWDDNIIRGILGITQEKLSEVVECTHVLKGFKPEYESILGISCDTPVVIGSGDGIMANIGCGVCDDTSFSSTIGTSGAIRTAVDKPLLDPLQRTWCYSFTKDMWVAGGAINNGGIILKWLREEFRKQFEFDAEDNESIYQLFNRYGAEIPAGSDGLIFLPYLTGERSPDWNANARGLMFGLGYSHGRKHIIRAAMEGVMYRLYSVYEVLSALRNNASQIRANGGYANSDLWLQIQADLFSKEVLVSSVTEASALGAAYTAMYALGAVKDIKSLLPSMAVSKVVRPIEENTLAYNRMYTLAMQVYGSLYNDRKG